MLNDFDTLRQMYATIFGGAVSLLEEGNVWEAKQVLSRAMEVSEELYIAGEQAADELEPLRKS